MTSALPGALPPYKVHGADGDVTGELVYANYGMPDDYRELARRGVQEHDPGTGRVDRLCAQDLPTVHEALDARDWSRADRYAAVTATVLDNYRAQLDQLTASLKQ